MNRLLKKIVLGGALVLGVAACSFKISEKHMALGTDFESKGQYKRALEEYQKVININEKPQLVASALERSAYINFRYVRDYQVAVKQFEEVFRSATEEEKKIQAMELLSEIYAEYLNDSDKSLEWQARLFNDYGKHHPNADQHYITYSAKLIESARYQQAIEVYDEFLKKFPAHQSAPRIMIQKGEAYVAIGMINDAISTYEEIIKTFSKSENKGPLVAEAFYGLGMSYEREDRLERALEYYEKALENYPNKKVVEIKIDGINRRKKLRGLR